MSLNPKPYRRGLEGFWGLCTGFKLKGLGFGALGLFGSRSRVFLVSGFGVLGGLRM